MDFGLSKKHEMARSLFKEFAENEVKPLAQEVDETEKNSQLEPLRKWLNMASLVFLYRRNSVDRVVTSLHTLCA